MRLDASFADARSLVGIANPEVLLVDSGEPVEVPGLLPFSWGRGVFRVTSGDGGLLILSLRGVRGSRYGFLMSTDMTLRIIPS